MRHTVLRAVLLAATFTVPMSSALAPAPAYARGAPDSFADLAASLLPAVVNIASSTTVTAQNDVGRDRGPGPDIPNFPPGSPFEQFFHDFMERNRPGQGGPNGSGRADPTPRKMQSLGSGFIIDPDGYIVTNNHVIEGADEITVILQDNTTLKAKLIGHDERADLALLKVEADHKLPAVAFGDSDTQRVGDWVLAIGNPFGLGGSVTAGIISARGRDIHQGPYDDFIQTDAPINRGNSGGPLFNMDGSVIGINTAIYSPSGGSIGIGFAIPSNMAKNVVAQLREYGHPVRGWLGVRIQQVTSDIAESLGLHNNDGAMVAGVNDGGPAAKADIHNGDVILKFNNQDVKEMRNLPRIVAETPIGKDVPVQVWRDGKLVSLQAEVAELPDDQQQQQASNTPAPAKPKGDAPLVLRALGLSIAPINSDTRAKYQIAADQKGVVVTDVARDGGAAQRGVKPGDIIVEIQQQAVTDPADVSAKIDAIRKQNRKSALVLIQGQDGLRWIPLPLAESDAKPG
jgi:serine protease Do